jgi:hypothetical protein
MKGTVHALQGRINIILTCVIFSLLLIAINFYYITQVNSGRKDELDKLNTRMNLLVELNEKDILSMHSQVNSLSIEVTKELERQKSIVRELGILNGYLNHLVNNEYKKE